MEVQFKIGVAEGGTWDPTNDPSYQATAGPQPEGAALRRRHPGLGRRARPGHRRTPPRRPCPAPRSRPAVTATGVDPDLGRVHRHRRQRAGRLRRLPRGRRNDVLVGSPTTTNSLTVTGLTAGTAVQLLRASPATAPATARRPRPPVTFTTLAATGTDTTAPTTPGTPTASAITATGVDPDLGGVDRQRRRHRLPGLPRGRHDRRAARPRSPAPRYAVTGLTAATRTSSTWSRSTRPATPRRPSRAGHGDHHGRRRRPAPARSATPPTTGAPASPPTSRSPTPAPPRSTAGRCVHLHRPGSGSPRPGRRRSPRPGAAVTAHQPVLQRHARAGRVDQLRLQRHAHRQQPEADRLHPQRRRLHHRLT